MRNQLEQMSWLDLCAVERRVAKAKAEARKRERDAIMKQLRELERR